MKNLASLLVLGAFAGGAYAATRNVPSQYPTIQAAINAAVNGDTVKVAAGTYFESPNITGKSVTLQGAGQGKSIIDGSLSPWGSGTLNFYSGGSGSADGFTCLNGNGGTLPGWGGGGLYVESTSVTVTNCTFANNIGTNGAGGWISNSTATIRNCTFSGNVGEKGGGMQCINSNPTVTNCAFTNNSAFGSWGDGGGGVYNKGSSGRFSGCTFSGNNSNDGASGAGGGMFIEGGGTPTLDHCSFNNNDAIYGGGILIQDSNPTLDDCSFNNNVANYGGGVSSSHTFSLITNCSFDGNQSLANGNGGGGGIYNGSGATGGIWGCTFTNNTAVMRGGGIFSENGANPSVIGCTFNTNFSNNRGGGGMYNLNGGSNTQVVVNCKFTGNTTNQVGGGLRFALGNATVINCTFTGNQAAGGGGGLRADFANVVMDNCILWGDLNGELSGSGSSVAVTYSDVQGGYAGIGNIDADPRFVNPLGHLQLQGNSPCIDAGNNAVVTAPPFLLNDSGVMIDLDGHRRISGNTVDMGAYEHSRNGGS